ncbi:hypothetical protein QQ020_26345 [Fulvivirgaceae bacterium BMA12]|uniref:Uncharacterized protein n=1 Tax=Agaribacillus aureus TaxID=3051825 RepID=A0ABT8LCX0_9BACT|nr:hypothetical protein [Fulvivirgaceae bacterium BMA12]
METNSFKVSIYEALETLDLDQIDQVLCYVRELQHSPERSSDYKRFRQNAMRQIKEALKAEKAAENFELQLA